MQLNRHRWGAGVATKRGRLVGVAHQHHALRVDNPRLHEVGRARIQAVERPLHVAREVGRFRDRSAVRGHGHLLRRRELDREARDDCRAVLDLDEVAQLGAEVGVEDLVLHRRLAVIACFELHGYTLLARYRGHSVVVLCGAWCELELCRRRIGVVVGLVPVVEVVSDLLERVLDQQRAATLEWATDNVKGHVGIAQQDHPHPSFGIERHGCCHAGVGVSRVRRRQVAPIRRLELPP
mmetsp:Transcript_41435/g.110547  ORF Transcript_41435/g.110547 Transcript_41435/m.110547 type:complete len:237 (-) Transcript_41435:1689-2399(-)